MKNEFEAFKERTKNTSPLVNKHLLGEGIILYIRYWLKRFGL